MSNQQNKKTRIDTHTARPQTLAGAIGGLFRIMGIRASDSDLTARWSEIMGTDIAALCQIAAIKKTRDNKYNIVLRPANPAQTLALSYRVGEITQKINKYFGYNAVSKISFRK